MLNASGPRYIYCLQCPVDYNFRQSIKIKGENMQYELKSRSKKYTSFSSVDYAYSALRNLIMKKELKPGQRLIETAIAEQLNISRTPVREALRKLASEHLVDIVPNEGARLSFPSNKEIRDSFALRSLLECESIKLAVYNISPVQICLMEEEIQKEEQTFVEKDPDTYLQINTNFHMIIAEASGNVALIDHIEKILDRTFVYEVFFESFFDFPNNPTLVDHKKILKSLIDKNELRAVELMKAHIMFSMESLKNVDK